MIGKVFIKCIYIYMNLDSPLFFAMLREIKTEKQVLMDFTRKNKLSCLKEGLNPFTLTSGQQTHIVQVSQEFPLNERINNVSFAHQLSHNRYLVSELLSVKMEQSTEPHVLALPFPAEGHIKPMFILTKLLSHKGLKITLVNSHHNHTRLHHFTDLSTFHNQFPMLHFTSITDGLPNDHPRSTLFDIFQPMISPNARSMVALEFRELFMSLLKKSSTCDQWQPPSCIIADGIMSTIAMSVAEEFRVPLIIFRTYSATCTWVTIHITKLIHEGVVTDQGQQTNFEVYPAKLNLEKFYDIHRNARILVKLFNEPTLYELHLLPFTVTGKVSNIPILSLKYFCIFYFPICI